MDGVPTRLPIPIVFALSLVTALALSLAVAVTQPAAAQEESSGDGDERVTVADYPGHVGVIVQNLLGDKVPTRRYRGEQRFDTARLIALDAFDNPSNVVIARGDIFPDALSGSYLAGQRDAPLLLTSSHRLEPDTLEALNDLDPDRVTLVGGTEAIAFSVASELGREGYPTNRVGGFDRFETAALVATAEDSVVGEREDHGRTAIVARADEFADALVAGTLSYTGEFPLLLTRGDRLHPDTSDALDTLAIDHVIVPGGSAAVSDDVVDEIAAHGIDVERVSGVDRVATSVKFAQFMRDEFGFGLDRINTAIGTRFADALALGPMSGPFGQPIVLTADENTLGGDGAVEEFLSQTCVVDLAGLGGGHAAITPDLEEELRDLATSTGAPCILDLVPDLALRDLGADHTLTGTLTDNAGNPVQGEDVRTEIYRATDLDLPVDLSLDELGLDALEDAVGTLPLDDLLGQVEGTLAEAGIGDVTFGGEPVHTFVDTTDENGQVESTYTGPDLPAVDVAVACLEDDADECVLLSVGDVLDPDSVETAPDVLSDSGIVLWGLDPGGLLPNLLLLEPPVAVNEPGGEHTVTASALNADLDSLDSGLLDLGEIGELGELVETLAGLDIDATGTLVPDTEVHFEVFRTTEELPQDLLDGLTGLVGSASGSDVNEGDLLEVLEGQDLSAALTTAGLHSVASGTETTDQNGEATFTYQGPDGLGLDLVVACLGEDGEQCAVLDGGLNLPDSPGVGLAAALWAPSDLLGLVEGLIDLLGEEQLLGMLTDAELANLLDILGQDFVDAIGEDLLVSELGSLDGLVEDTGLTEEEVTSVLENDLSLLRSGFQGTLTAEQVEAAYSEHEDGVEGRR